MKTLNFSVLVRAAGIIAVVGALFYFGTRNQKSSLPPPPSANSHSHDMAADTPPTSLGNMINSTPPAFSLSDSNGNIYSYENLRGKNVIMFFNEGLMCYPACWNQIIALAKDACLNDGDTVVLSVVTDSSEEWRKAVNKMPELAKAKVVFDDGAVVSNKFGMLTVPSSMHYGSLPGHTYVLMDKAGIIRHVYDDPAMAIHNDQLAAEIQALK